MKTIVSRGLSNSLPPNFCSLCGTACYKYLSFDVWSFLVTHLIHLADPSLFLNSNRNIINKQMVAFRCKVHVHYIVAPDLIMCKGLCSCKAQYQRGRSCISHWSCGCVWEKCPMWKSSFEMVIISVYVVLTWCIFLNKVVFSQIASGLTFSKFKSSNQCSQIKFCA